MLTRFHSAGFVEIGRVQLSRSVKTANVTDKHTGRHTVQILAPCTHPGTSREVSEERRPHTCSRRCVFIEKRIKNAAAKTHYEIYSSPETATTSKKRATKHVRRVSPCSPGRIDPRFVEVVFVNLSSSVKRQILHIRTDVSHSSNDTLYAPR